MNLEDQFNQLKTEAKLLWANRRSFLLAVAMLLAAFLVGWFLTYQEYDQISFNQDEVQELQDAIDEVEARETTWRRALQDPDFASGSALVNDILPSKKPILESIYAFNQLATQHPINLTKFEFAPGEVATSGARTTTARRATTTTGYDYLLINVDMSGEYYSLLTALQAMQTMEPIGNIYNLQLSRGTTGIATARVTYFSYYYDQSVGGGSGTNLPSISPADRENLAVIADYTALNDQDLQQDTLQGGGKVNLFEQTINAGQILDASDLF